MWCLWNMETTVRLERLERLEHEEVSHMEQEGMEPGTRHSRSFLLSRRRVKGQGSDMDM